MSSLDKKKTKKHRAVRILSKILIGLLILFTALVLFIRSQWGQSIITDKLVNYLTEKTQTELAIDKLYLSFGGNLILEGLYIADTRGDTLVYSKSLEANIPVWPVIQGNGIGIDALEWEGLRANIIRKDTLSGYNFQFLIDAFTADKPTKPQKDSISEPINLALGNLNFKNLNIVFKDAVLGIDSRFIIGKLALDMEKTDINELDFRADEIKLANSRIKFHQKNTSNNMDDNETATTTLPYLSVNEITIRDVLVDYQSEPEQLTGDFSIADFFLEIPKIDLKNNQFELGKLNLNNSSITLNKNSYNINNKIIDTLRNNNNIAHFDWPKMAIKISGINLKKNNITYTVNHNHPQKGIFNPNAISLSNLQLSAKDIFLKDKKAEAHFQKFSFEETSGLALENFAFQLALSDKDLSLNILALALNNSKLSGNIAMTYHSLAEAIATPKKSKISLQIPNFNIATGDVFAVQPKLRKNKYIKALSQHPIRGKLTATGYLNDIRLDDTKIEWDNTQFAVTGHLINAIQPKALAFNLPMITAQTTRTNLSTFINEQELGIALPEKFTLTANASGTLNDFNADANIESTAGAITAQGHFKNTEEIAIDGKVNINKLALNKILNDSLLKTITLTIHTKLKGENINKLNGEMQVNVLHAGLNNYEIKNLDINGNFNNGKGHITSGYKDENLNAKLDANVILDSINSKAKINLDVKKVDLQALGLMQRNIKAGLQLNAVYQKHKTGFDLSGTVKNGVVVYDNKNYLLGNIKAKTQIRKDTTTFNLNNRLVQLHLTSNTDPETFFSSLNRHVKSYFYRDTKLPDSIVHPVNLQLKAKLRQTPILNEVFLVNIKDLDTISIAVDFNEQQRKLDAKITAPAINYNGNSIDSLAFAINTNKDLFDFDFGFKEIKIGPLSVPKTTIKGKQRNHNLHLDFWAFDKDKILTEIHSTISGQRDSLVFRVLPKKLVFNKSNWTVPEDNAVFIFPKKISFREFSFSKNNQSIKFTEKLPSVENKHIGIISEHFKLEELLGYLNPDNNLVTGKINGFFALENPFGKTGISAALTINNLKVLNEDLGILKLDAQLADNNLYSYDLTTNGGQIDLKLTGDYSTVEDGNINAALIVNKFNMSALDGLTQNETTNGKGFLSGRFDVSGNPSNPNYKGNLIFTNAYLKVKKLNAGFSLNNERIDIDNSGISMTKFTILDQDNNPIVFDGKIGTKNFLNPTFNLNISAKKFGFINATEEDNELLYGKGSFNATTSVTGNLQIPKIKINATVNKATDLTYVLPTATVNIEKRDGVVVFVNRENPDATLTKTKEQTATITGLNIIALIKVDKEATFTVILDKATGDNFKISGQGDFNFTMKPNGRINLTGIYDISNGHYQMSLYNLVKRKFELMPQSRVRWSGDPFNAQLDIKAAYNIETSASALMASQTSGSDPEVKSKFRQELPFIVFLNLDGELMQPRISFNLDMPEDERGAIGGQVYGRLQQVNQQEDELNRQVFSLLVLNKFYPEPGSDGSNGGFTSVVNNNLNDAISDQLNIFSNKLFKDTGFQLDFGLDTYTDYQGQTSQEHTQLEVAAKQKLFNNRLIVSVGSEVDIDGQSSDREATPIIGNVNIEYLLTKNGKYRLKGFRKNEYENIIDGQTIISGIALIFTQEFNKFNELWNAMFKKEK